LRGWLIGQWVPSESWLAGRLALLQVDWLQVGWLKVSRLLVGGLAAGWLAGGSKYCKIQRNTEEAGVDIYLFSWRLSQILYSTVRRVLFTTLCRWNACAAIGIGGKQV